MPSSPDTGHKIFPRKFKAKRLQSFRPHPFCAFLMLTKRKAGSGDRLQSKLLQQLDVTKNLESTTQKCKTTERLLQLRCSDLIVVFCESVSLLNHLTIYIHSKKFQVFLTRTLAGSSGPIVRLTCLVSCDLKRTVSSARPRIYRKHESPGSDQSMMYGKTDLNIACNTSYTGVFRRRAQNLG